MVKSQADTCFEYFSKLANKTDPHWADKERFQEFLRAAAVNDLNQASLGERLRDAGFGPGAIRYYSRILSEFRRPPKRHRKSSETGRRTNYRRNR